MRIKLFALVMLTLPCVSLLKAQEFTVPRDYVLAEKEDYSKYEKDIIACANWLENTPLGTEADKHKEANVFFMKWLKGSPSVNISISEDYVLKYTEDNPDLLIIFLAGYTRYALENSNNKEIQDCFYEGYKSMINVYKKGVGVKKDKNLDKLVKMFDKDELQSWIHENIK
jgi:hypothetical protein